MREEVPRKATGRSLYRLNSSSLSQETNTGANLSQRLRIRRNNLAVPSVREQRIVWHRAISIAHDTAGRRQSQLCAVFPVETRLSSTYEYFNGSSVCSKFVNVSLIERLCTAEHTAGFNRENIMNRYTYSLYVFLSALPAIAALDPSRRYHPAPPLSLFKAWARSYKSRFKSQKACGVSARKISLLFC